MPTSRYSSSSVSSRPAKATRPSPVQKIFDRWTVDLSTRRGSRPARVLVQRQCDCIESTFRSHLNPIRTFNYDFHSRSCTGELFWKQRQLASLFRKLPAVNLNLTDSSFNKCPHFQLVIMHGGQSPGIPGIVLEFEVTWKSREKVVEFCLRSENFKMFPEFVDYLKNHCIQNNE